MGEVAERTVSSIAFFFVLLLLILSSPCFCSAKALEYHTLTIKPLSKPPTFNPDVQWPESEYVAASESELNSSSFLPLVHRDSLHSNSTGEELLRLRLQRDELRVRGFSRRFAGGFNSSVTSGLSVGSGEYFTKIGVGTPPEYTYMVVDTGSDVVWLQCAPCRRCYSQKGPVFDPSRSRSFSPVRCRSRLCHLLDSPYCARARAGGRRRRRSRSCAYTVTYGDGSFTSGEFSTETLTFRRVAVPGIPLGCGHDNEGLFVGAAGLLGLGRGPLSFPSQASGRFGGKFSYCLVDRTSSRRRRREPSSYIIFGEASVPRSAVFTSMLANPKLGTFYYVELTGVSVGGKMVPGANATVFRLDSFGDGGAIVDSGTSVTRLVAPAYVALREAFSAAAKHLRRAAPFSLFDTCFDLSGLSEVRVPTLALHFGSNGAGVALPAENYLIPVSGDGTFCLAFAGTSNPLSIIGNIQQQGFRIVFDVPGRRIGFAARSCG